MLTSNSPSKISLAKSSDTAKTPIHLENFKTAQKITQQFENYDVFLSRLLGEKAYVEKPLLIKQAPPPNNNFLGIFERYTTPVMFWLALLALICMGATLMFHFMEKQLIPVVIHILILKLNILLWVFFALELVFLGRLAYRQPQLRKALWFRCIVLFIPILRIGMKAVSHPNHTWLPFWHWSEVNRSLFDALRKIFSTPMIVIALFIVPLLLVEYKLKDDIVNHPAIYLLISTVQTFIWAAFVFEFTLMVSIAEEKIDYCKRNWIDILIIILPFISFFRTLRIMRLVKLKELVRVYRLRGVLMKTQQALVITGFIQRLILYKLSTPEKTLNSLRKNLREKKKEYQELSEKIASTIERLEKKNAENTKKPKD